MTQSPKPAQTAERRRLCGAAAIRAALDGEQAPRLRLILCREGDRSEAAREVVERAVAAGIPILVESAREMRRMSESQAGEELIAMLVGDGMSPGAGLEDLMSSDGLVFILDGLRYPGNVGFILRSAEVAGAAGVVLSTAWQGSELEEARRIGMHADRFFPVVESDAQAAIEAARRCGRQVVALETVGEKTIWEAPLVAPTAVLIGGETTGVAAALLEAADAVLRIPTRGFIPSYNVQAAVAMVLGEWMRQSDLRAD